LRLTQLEIFGFKSFAHKIVIPFDPGITAIVGPNGCGKSNVVEAIRWVLGEQRAGTFRSHKMEEVIFAGTSSRKALGMSEVALTIENRENVLPVEFNEVMLTRRLFRSGESDYLMNKIPCRLLDITNLLMDTGLGQGAYSVMEQGMIDEIVSEKTENRRRILEEAAGITKYKTRRRSTWNRLEATQADLTRIEDIIAEVKRQVDYLGRQVGRARRYQEYKQELDQLEVQLGRYNFFTIHAELKPIEEEFAGINKGSESGYTHFTTREAELEKARLSLTDAERQMQEAGLQLNSRVEEIHGKERELVALRGRREASEQAAQRAGREVQDYQQQLESTRTQRSENTDRLGAVREELATTEQQLEGRETEARHSEEEYRALRSTLEGQQRQRMDDMRQQADTSRSLERQQAEHESLGEREEGMRGELEEFESERQNAHERHGTLESQLAETSQQLHTVRHRHDGTLSTATVVRQDLETLQEQRAELRRTTAANEARLQVLQKLRSGYEGYASGVRTLMLESPYANLFQGVLGDLVDVGAEHARAVETALGESLQALITQGHEGVLEAITHLKENSGRAGIFALDWPMAPLENAILPAAPGLFGPLLDFVRADAPVAPLLQHLLYNTYLVDNLDSALTLARQHTELPLRFITPEGDAIDLYGRVAGGKAGDEESTVLGRRREIRLLCDLLARQKAQVVSLELRIRAQDMRRITLEQTLRTLDDEVSAWREEERELTHRHQNTNDEIQRLEARLNQLRAEIARLTERSQTLSTAIVEQRLRLEEIELKSKELETAIADGETQLQESERVRQEKRDQLGVLRVERARAAESAQSLERDAERLGNIEESITRNIERLERERQQASNDYEERGGQISRIEEELKTLHEGREVLAAEQDERRQHWAQLNAQNRELEEQISRMQRDLNNQRERRHQLELRISELGNNAKNIRERLQEEQHCDIEAMGPPEEEVDAEEAQRRLDQLRQALHRLGSVHLGVLDEYEEQKERYDFLVQQRDDLVVAAEDLKKTLNLIDRTARRMFVETFTQIREKFQQTYARFFEGGQADLKLEEGVDPLEASIDITARPRGKQLQSIALLSGGERALTAISLLFAIYLVKPSPFCILDEVDAPLDDTNISRFVRVLKEFALKTQFIVVTHNKITMSAADTLHGVTMPEEGISQLVSVRVDESEEFVEAAG
jgi:chromosome segregation protein